jgi:hypothetical protein
VISKKKQTKTKQKIQSFAQRRESTKKLFPCRYHSKKILFDGSLFMGILSKNALRAVTGFSCFIVDKKSKRIKISYEN